MHSPIWKINALVADKKICKRNVSQIVEDIKQYEAAILNNFDKETLDVYLFLKDRLQNDVSSDLVFHFVFRSFYRIDNAGLDKDFKSKYFEVFQEIKNQKICFKDIDSKLKEVSVMLKDKDKDEPKPSLQFSFVTKMVGLICDDCPIYDSEVARVFGFDYVPSNLERHERLEKLIQRHMYIHQVYQEIVDKKLLEEVFSSFKHKFGCIEVHDIKVLDFIFWQAGKEILKEKRENKRSALNDTDANAIGAVDHMSM